MINYLFFFSSDKDFHAELEEKVFRIFDKKQKSLIVSNDSLSLTFNITLEFYICYMAGLRGKGKPFLDVIVEKVENGGFYEKMVGSLMMVLLHFDLGLFMDLTFQNAYSFHKFDKIYPGFSNLEDGDVYSLQDARNLFEKVLLGNKVPLKLNFIDWTSSTRRPTKIIVNFKEKEDSSKLDDSERLSAMFYAFISFWIENDRVQKGFLFLE